MSPSPLRILTLLCALAATAITPLASSQPASKLSASIGRQYLQLGESLDLLLTYNYTDNEQPPRDEELSPTGGWHSLRDFDLVGRRYSRSSSYSIQGGQVTRHNQVRWRLSLAPRHSGTLQIPAFAVRGHHSLALPLPVAAASGQQVPFSVRLVSSSARALVGQQLILTLEVSAASDVQLRGVNIRPLQQLDAELVELPHSTDHRLRDGALVQTRHYRFALFPRSTGELQIPAILVSGQSRQRRLVRRSEPISIAVGPAPSAPSAESLELAAQWPQEPLRMGEPARWRLSLEALGSATPPPIEVPPMADMRQYRGNYQDSGEQTAQGLHWRRALDIDLVPRRPGPIAIPELRIPWWDSTTGRLRTARLPARTLNVLPAAASASALLPPSSADALQRQGPAPPQILPALPRPALLIAALLLAALAVLALVAPAFRRLRHSGRRPRRLRRAVPSTLAWLRLACARSPATASAALATLLRAYGPRAASAAAESPPLRRQMAALHAQCFAATPPPWDGRLPLRLCVALRRALRRPRRRAAALTPLYPPA